MNDTWSLPGTPSKSRAPKRSKAPSMRSPIINTHVILDLKEIEQRVKEFERKELIRHMLIDKLDENVEHLMKEVYMVLKMLHGEEVGKEISFFRNNLLEKREIALEKQRRREQGELEPIVVDSSKWTGITNLLGGNDDDDIDPPF